MSVEYVVSQYSGSPAKNMLDGNKSTWWESDWSSSATYFEPGDYFIIDLGKVREDLSQIIFTPRQDNQNGHIYEFEIYTSAVEGDLTDTDIANEANGFTFAGIAISDSPTGPFKYLCTRRVTMTGVLTTGNGDGMLRDMTLFKDDDGTAYVVYSSEENATTIIHKLNDEYTGLSGDLEDISQNTPANFTESVDYVRVFAGQYREAPAMFKDGDTYYLITSGQSGWNPNPCKYSYVEGDIFGEWAPNKKFAVNDIPYGTQQETTFRSQSTFILPVRDEDGNKVPGKFVYMGDRWFRENLQGSRYIWLPLNFNGETHEITMEWQDEWSFENLIGDYEPEYELGDVNHDKAVDVLDVTAIQKYLVSVEDENFDVKLADVNEDGAINIKDATTIQLKLSK